MMPYLGDRTGYFNNDPLWTKEHHLPHQQWRLYN